MTSVLVTGAGGFVGRALARRLCEGDARFPVERLTLLDLGLNPDEWAAMPNVRVVRGSLADAQARAEALADAPRLVFHLAAITSGQAEREFDLGLEVNVHATLALFDDLRRLPAPTRVVQTSSIGVFGLPLPQAMDDDTPIAPTLSYGAQKRMMEIMLADHSRRGWLDGRSPRLPSVVARPALPNGALSSFASDLMRELAEGRRYRCPVDADGTLWLLSLPACVEALLHAADVPPERLPATRAWTLPSVRASVAELVAALARRFGPDLLRRIDYAPDPTLIPQFARWPVLRTACADRLGFRADAGLDALVAHALADEDAPSLSVTHAL